jgi:hypothetical protein
VRAQLDRLGITSDVLDERQIELVLGALEKGLRVFVGSAKASGLVKDVRTALKEGR